MMEKSSSGAASLRIGERVNRGTSGIKPYVPGKSVAEVQRELGIDRPLKMASNENPLGISPKARKAVRRVARSAYRYPERNCPSLTDALSAKLELPPEKIIVGNGADSIIYTLGMSLLDEGDETVIPEITFPLYEIIARAMRTRVINSPMKGLEIDLEAVSERITENTKMVWICNPNNPTGTLISRERLETFLNRVPMGVFVVHDEVYSDFADPLLYPETVAMVREGRENLFLIRSFSKVYGMAGVRLGYGMGPEDLVALMYRIRPPFDTSLIAEAAGIGALQDEAFYRRTLESTRRERGFLAESLERIGLPPSSSHTNFLLVDTGRDGAEVCDRLLEQGIIARPCSHYGLPRHIRVTVGLRRHNRRFIAALEKIIRA